MSSNHKAPLAAFVVVAIACVVVLATNSMRSYARDAWNTFAAPVVSGLTLIPTRHDAPQHDAGTGQPAGGSTQQALAARSPAAHPTAPQHGQREGGSAEDMAAGAVAATPVTSLTALVPVPVTAPVVAPVSAPVSSPVISSILQSVLPPVATAARAARGERSARTGQHSHHGGHASHGHTRTVTPSSGHTGRRGGSAHGTGSTHGTRLTTAGSEHRVVRAVGRTDPPAHCKGAKSHADQSASDGTTGAGSASVDSCAPPSATPGDHPGR